MASIVLGVGTSHTPMLYTEPHDWPQYETRDRRMELLDRDGNVRAYDDLAREAGPEVERALTPEHLASSYQACQSHLDRVAMAVAETAPDTVIIVGDDQKELFQEENLPAILLYRGESILNKHRAPKPGEPPWWSDALSKYYGRGRDETMPVDASLANHLIGFLMAEEFDVAQSTRLPEGLGEGHAFAFIHSRILDHRSVPVVPVFLNTYYPPNQPTPRRCYRLGAKIAQAVEQWETDARVAVIASGGLSHFVVDPELDQTVLHAFAEHDAETLVSLPTHKLNSGTSEIRNWIVMCGATEHLQHAWHDYVPAYRTPAGTGTGCAFGYRS